VAVLFTGWMTLLLPNQPCQSTHLQCTVANCFYQLCWICYITLYSGVL